MTSSDTRAPKKKGQYLKKDSKFHNYKVCAECGENKLLKDYRVKSKKAKLMKAADPNKYFPRCRECMKIKDARKVDPNFVFDPTTFRGTPLTPEERRAADAKRKRNTRAVTRVKLMAYLADKGCSACGERDPRVLELDHINPLDKTDNVSRMVATGCPWTSDKLQEELKKCRVLCANCHRVWTINQQGHYNNAIIKRELRKILQKYDITREVRPDSGSTDCS